MQFLRINLENWRNFTKVNTCLQKRVFIVGPNASGKSNFLDAMRFLSDIVSTDGGFQKAIEKRGGVSKIRCLSARRHPTVVLRVEMGDEIIAPEWTYQIEFSQDNLRRAVLKNEVVLHKNIKVLERPNDQDKSDPERLTQTHLEQVAANKEFRDIARLFNSVKYLHIVPQLVREPDRSVGRTNDPFGGDFLEQLARRPSKTTDSRLKKITHTLRVAVPQLKELVLKRDARGTPHLGGLYEHWRPNAGWQSENQFSDGTLRLLGLLWAVLDGAGPLLLEEPELSLHAEVVRYIPQMLARLTRKNGRQVVVSSHSTDFLRDSGIAPDEVLLLNPTPNGTEVISAEDDAQVKHLVDAGETIADAVFPRTAPRNAIQLSLFGD